MTPPVPDWHERLSVSGVCSNRLSLVEDLGFWRRHRIHTVGVPARKLVDPTVVTRIVDAGIRVSNLLILGPRLDRPADWSTHRQALLDLFAAARAVQAEAVVVTTGSAGQLPWDEAVSAFAEFLGPVLPGAPCPVLVEHTNQLRSDISFVHRLRDAIDLARTIGIGVAAELTACWQERELDATVRDAQGLLGLVQVSDLPQRVGALPDRLVPGDGVLPLPRLLRSIVTAGYDGRFELEYAGPSIETEGYDAAVERALPALHRLLVEAAA